MRCDHDTFEIQKLWPESRGGIGHSRLTLRRQSLDTSAFPAEWAAFTASVLYLQIQLAAGGVALERGPEIEVCVRLVRTVRGQFLVELDARGGAGDLAELNALFGAWVEVVYHRRTHSETKTTPLERFLSAGPPALPPPELLHEAFLWSEWRRVTKVAQVALHGNAFEVDAALVGRKVELVFDPFDLTDIEVRFEGRAMGKAVAVRIGRHVHPKARPDVAPAPVPTGIDYLSLVAARREAELAGTPIDYAAMADADDTTPDGPEEDRP